MNDTKFLLHLLCAATLFWLGTLLTLLMVLNGCSGPVVAIDPPTYCEEDPNDRFFGTRRHHGLRHSRLR